MSTRNSEIKRIDKEMAELMRKLKKDLEISETQASRIIAKDFKKKKIKIGDIDDIIF